MHSALFLAGLLPVLAIAKPIEQPIHKRGYHYEVNVVTVFKTITVDGPAPVTLSEPTGNVLDRVYEPEDGSAEDGAGGDDVTLPEDEDLSPEEVIDVTTAAEIISKESTAPTESASVSPTKPAIEETPAPEPNEKEDEVEEEDEEEEVEYEGYGSAESGQRVEPTDFHGVTGSDLPNGQSSSPGDTEFQDIMLQAHNIHRANHSARALTWSDSLEQTAMKSMKPCIYRHDTKMDNDPDDKTDGYGQNIAYWTSPDRLVDQSLHEMYNDELMNHAGQWTDGHLPAYYPNFDHFTAMVWQNTTEVGCAVQYCPILRAKPKNAPKESQDYSERIEKAWLFYCNYQPAGNGNGNFDLVAAPENQPPVRLTYTEDNVKYWY